MSVLDRPFSAAHGIADGIRHPVVEPGRDVRAFQTVLLDLGARLGLPGMTKDDGSPQYPGGYPDYLVNHERKPGIGPLAGWRGKGGTQKGIGAPNPNQLEKYIENGCFWTDEMPMDIQFFKHANQGYLDYAKTMGWIGDASPIVFQLYNEDLQKFRLSAQGHGKKQPPAQHKGRIETYFDPLPIWYAPFEERDVDTDAYPMHALSQRPMHMYHSWGSQNTWLRQITGFNKLHIHKDMAASLGIGDDDWVWIKSRHGRVKGQVKLITGVNKNTVWTWNAIGKRKGAWGLKHDSPEFNKGFLLNHIISDVLMPDKSGHEYSNSDPVTGQAAWYDLRVKIEKCSPDEFGETSPIYAATKGPVSDKDISQYGKDIQGAPTGGRVQNAEWIGQRHFNSTSISGIKDGHGNKIKGEK